MKIKLLLLAILIACTAQAQSTDGKKIDQLVNRVIKELKKFDTTDIAPFRKVIISDDEIQDFITAMDADEEFKEEIRANINDGMFRNALEASFKDFVNTSSHLNTNWKNIEYEDFLYEMRKRDGIKQLRGELFLKDGEKHYQVRMTAALLNGKYVVIELEDFRDANNRRDAEAEAEEMIREMEEAMEAAAEEAAEGEYEAEEELIDRMERMEYESREEIYEHEPVEQPLVEGEIIDFPDVEAQFPGGTGALQKFINENVQYPSEAIEKGIQGRVYLSFVVETDGSLTNITVDRGVSPELDREAKRVVRAMPKWIPGEARGKKIRTKARLPIIFEISDR